MPPLLRDLFPIMHHPSLLRLFCCSLLLVLSLAHVPVWSAEAEKPPSRGEKRVTQEKTSAKDNPSKPGTTGAEGELRAEQPSIVLPVISLQGLLPPKPEPEVPEVPPEPSFGSHFLDWMMQNAEALRGALDSDVATLVKVPELEKWWAQQQKAPRLAERWDMLQATGGLLLLWGLGTVLALHLLLLPLRRNLSPAQNDPLLSKLGLGLGQFALGLVPVVGLLLLALSVLAEAQLHIRVRMVLQGGVYAAIFARILMLAGQFFLAPYHAPLRLVPVDAGNAGYFYRWLCVLAVLAVGGAWLLDAARLMEMPEEPRRISARLLGLALLFCLIVIVRHSRAPVAQWLRGKTAENAGDLLSWARRNLADHWHRLMIAYLLIGYTVTVMSGGFAALLQGTFTTLLVFLAMSLLLYGLNQLAARAAAAQARQERLPLHQPVLLSLLRILVSVGGLALILLGWNVDFSAWMKTDLMQRLTGAGFSISVAIIVAVLAYEILCSLLERARLRNQTGAGAHDAGARMQTLLPLIRHSAAVVLTVAVLLIGLSELGVNIAPLLAGAGIAGVALGFGSQALVKDVITGLFIIIEDTIHVGDIVNCGAHGGVVESMTIRTLRLRDVNGHLHVLPYSEVTGFINMTRGFAFAVMEIGVSYDTDLRKAFAVMAEVGEGLRQDGVIGPNILAAPEVNGVMNFADYSIVIRVRIKTLPGQQWAVRFAYMLAIKERFDREGITIPFPTVTHYMQQGMADAAATLALPPKSAPSVSGGGAST